MPVTEAEIEAVAKAFILEMFAPHELPVADDIFELYCRTAEHAIKALDDVRSGKKRDTSSQPDEPHDYHNLPGEWPLRQSRA